jgi:integrase/recombinase XerD
MSVQDIERRDMLKFIAFLRDEKSHTLRSCWNKFSNVMSFLKAQGIRTSTPIEQGGLGIKKNDWPKFVEEEPEIYEQDELDKFFAACDHDERLWFKFFLMTGMREQEVIHTYWSDVNFNHDTVRVKQKHDRGWTPKTYEEREIPIPDQLTVMLKDAKRRADKNCNLVFPTSGCHVKMDFLDCCKAVAKRAKLNCGTCEQCKAMGTCERWFLHKFRATFATLQLRNGVDLSTVQRWMGHKDMESTMRYLKPNRGREVREKVNSTFA